MVLKRMSWFIMAVWLENKGMPLTEALRSSKENGKEKDKNL